MRKQSKRTHIVMLHLIWNVCVTAKKNTAIATVIVVAIQSTSIGTYVLPITPSVPPGIATLMKTMGVDRDGDEEEKDDELDGRVGRMIYIKFFL